MVSMNERRLRETVLRGLGGEAFEEDFSPCSNLFLPIGGWRVTAGGGRVSVEAGAVRFDVSAAGVSSRLPEGYLRGEEHYERIGKIIKSSLSSWRRRRV